MIKKSIHQTTTIFELCSTHPDLIDTLVQLGFHDIANPLMRNSVGKIMTLEKGARAKRLEWEEIKKVLCQNGYEITE